MLYYKDLIKISNEARGVKDDFIAFEQIYFNPSEKVNKGLFVLVSRNEYNENEMKEALYNGAIAALWPQNKELPRFLPNHFPVFIVENTLAALKLVLKDYLKKRKENRYDKMTKFMLFDQDKHNDAFSTYDKSVIEDIDQMLQVLNAVDESEGRG
ncbi:hypothetical protein [Fredinandcohnia quinoae]|uniref:Uncharacterized protein n=1 Tax=Fredinandcohnia quinoae TaxID=2918902 RepID=A0AAW5DV13_9BACI|nr:hypothetical protein [Fredinandcohnia sp. SECRCQ15]MCH1623878.1 hypothetical protein [Fredinandcohnia sp. SECRCQ15]